jgi:cellulose synthase/poly-beta-1,6-N-acetylglucosamine synthase-like glycosyltransferase
MMLSMLFWLVVLVVLHSYLIYPFVLWIVAKNKKESVFAMQDILPTVTMVVSVYNEEKILLQKIQNILMYDYPVEKFTVCFGLDGADDGSESVIRNAATNNIQVVSFKERRGKASVLNDLVAQASGEIIVFSDANTEFEPQTIKELVKHFQNPHIGAVSGHLKLINGKGHNEQSGEMSYWEFENIVKALESNACSLLGATGAVYAIRKSLFVPLPVNLSVADDFLIPIEILKKKYRCLFEPQAIAYEEQEQSIMGEYRRKVRIGAQNFNVLPHIFPLLHPRYGFIAFSLWSHKIIRWFIPLLLIFDSMLLLLLLRQSIIYQIGFVAWIVFVCAALLGWLADKLKMAIGYAGYPFYFIAMNFALLVGLFKALCNKQKPTWNVVR